MIIPDTFVNFDNYFFQDEDKAKAAASSILKGREFIDIDSVVGVLGCEIDEYLDEAETF